MFKSFFLILVAALFLAGCNEDLGDKTAPSSGASPGSILALLDNAPDPGSGSSPEGAPMLMRSFSFSSGFDGDSGLEPDSGSGEEDGLMFASAFSFDGGGPDLGGGPDSSGEQGFMSNGPSDEVHANPEPGTLALLGIGLAGLAASRLKKRTR